MTTSTARPAPHESDTEPEALACTNPRTGEQIGSVPMAFADEVREAVDRARDASTQWAAMSARGRRNRLDRWRHTMAHRQSEILDLLHRETGKVDADGLIELNMALHHLQWAARHAGGVLAARTVRSGLLMLGHTSTLVRRPYGVVGVIGPWNYPVYTPMGSLAYALATGNAVVFKPSEHSALIGQWLADTFADANPDLPVFQIVHGTGATGAALIDVGVDKIAFTGSARTGSAVMAACAQHLTPVLMELGGKDAAIIDADADLDDAADAVVWGAVMNAGQTCAGVERVYAVDSVYDRFLELVIERTRSLVAGIDYGAITMSGQVDVIERHIASAIEDGGSAVVGGPDSVRAPLVDPVVLVDVPETSPAAQEETFGPVLIVNRVSDIDEAIERANSVPFALGGAVFSRSRGQQIATRLQAGMVSINGVVDFGAVPALPFGGNGKSGFGRIHGVPGLEEFTTCLSVTRRRFRLPVRPQRFTRTLLDLPALRGLLAMHRQW